MPFTAIYIRASPSKQDTRSQRADLLAFKAAIESKDEECRIYEAKRSGMTYDHQQEQRLWDAVQAGQVERMRQPRQWPRRNRGAGLNGEQDISQWRAP